MTRNEIIELVVERAADRALHELHVRKLREPQRLAEEKAQLEKGRETFREAARQYGLSDIEANFNVVRSVLGPSFDVYHVGQIAVSNAASLVPASQAELEQWAREAQEERVDFLVNQASPHELRQAARQESEQRRIEAQQQHVAQQVQIREQAEAAFGFPASLPETTQDGVKIDRAYLLKLADIDIKKYKQLCSRFGMANVTARLNGVR